MYIQRRAPHGTNYAHEGLEVALIGAAFDQLVTLAFIDDGVFQLKKGQHTEALGIKNFTAAFGALGDFDVQQIFVERESLIARGLNSNQLMKLTKHDENDNTEKSLIEIVDNNTLAKLIAEQDVLLNF